MKTMNDNVFIFRMLLKSSQVYVEQRIEKVKDRRAFTRVIRDILALTADCDSLEEVQDVFSEYYLKNANKKFRFTFFTNPAKYHALGLDTVADTLHSIHVRFVEGNRYNYYN